jgi:hypothetical protein
MNVDPDPNPWLKNFSVKTLTCFRDATGKETTVHVDINGEKFVGHGLTVIGRQNSQLFTF